MTARSNSLRTQLGKHGIELNEKFDPATAGESMADKSRLEQLFILTWCINARDALSELESPDRATAAGGRTIDVEICLQTGRTAGSATGVRIAVSDNGPGIPAGNQGKNIRSVLSPPRTRTRAPAWDWRSVTSLSPT